ncbi:hypothetical protein [Alienimonas sp. DA493]|uniref:hypothetical protein n=1 Tax=Alienimonas sp. DA493 TaxID=3373605 RepID=UPI003755299E
MASVGAKAEPSQWSEVFGRPARESVTTRDGVIERRSRPNRTLGVNTFLGRAAADIPTGQTASLDLVDGDLTETGRSLNASNLHRQFAIEAGTLCAGFRVAGINLIVWTDVCPTDVGPAECECENQSNGLTIKYDCDDPLPEVCGGDPDPDTAVCYDADFVGHTYLVADGPPDDCEDILTCTGSGGQTIAYRESDGLPEDCGGQHDPDDCLCVGGQTLYQYRCDTVPPDPCGDEYA